jgi:phosphonate transport system substrate-binding protein
MFNTALGECPFHGLAGQIKRLARGFLFAAGLTGASLAAQAGPTFSLAVVPQFSAEQISRDWTPLVDAIAHKTGIRLELKSYASIPAFEAAFLKGEPDVAYMNPYHAVMAKRAAGYQPIIRDGEKQLTGILLVRKDSPIRELRQLEGASLAFPAPNAFGASLYMRALLGQEAGIRFTPNYVKTHSNVYRHVMLGKAVAGGSIGHALDKESPEVRDQLRVLYETPPANSHPIVVHPRVPAMVRKALQQALLELGERPEAVALLKAIQIPRPTLSNYKDYAPLERLGLDRYVVVGEH